jgi:YbbR domain-containing protein
MKHTRTLISYLGSLLLALVLASIIWLNATRTQDPITTQFLQLDVNFVGQPENSILAKPDKQSVQIRVEGPQSALNQVSLTDFNAFVDLTQTPFGESVSMPIEISTLNSDLDISPIPNEVEVLLEQQVSRNIPVELDIRGEVARGHTQGNPLVEPTAIIVSGPASLVEQLDFALATVFLNDTLETTIGEHRPIFYDEQGRVASTANLNLSTEEVQVTVPVVESDGFADKLITVDWIGYPAPGYRLLSVTMEPPSVLVKGLPARVNALTRLQTEPIDITGLTSSFTQQATLDLPTGVSLDQDQEMFVTIEIEPILSTDTRERKVEILGLREDMETSLGPEQVRVVLFGPLPLLDTLAADDVRVTVDLFDLAPGTHFIQPDVDIPDRGIEVRSIRPETIHVTITQTLAQTITQTLTQTITNTDWLTGTLPITETNKSLLLFIANMKPEIESLTHSAAGTSILPVAQSFYCPARDLAQYAILPARRIFL